CAGLDAGAIRRQQHVSTSISIGSPLVGGGCGRHRARVGLGRMGIARYRIRPPQVESRLVRFPIPPPENTSYRGGQVSPDGRSVALLGVETSGRKQIWLRRLDSLAAQPLAAATEGDLIWSPDSRFIAFLQDGTLKKIDVSGGPPQIICNAELVVGGTWNRDGTIIFG